MANKKQIIDLDSEDISSPIRVREVPSITLEKDNFSVVAGRSTIPGKIGEYRVVATNFIGVVYSNDDEKLARKHFKIWAKKSSQGYGSVGHETISLMKGDETLDVYAHVRGETLPSHFTPDEEEFTKEDDEE